MPERLAGRVLQFTAGVYRVHTPAGTFDCSLRGRVKQEAGEPVAIGDLVSIERLEDGNTHVYGDLAIFLYLEDDNA